MHHTSNATYNKIYLRNAHVDATIVLSNVEVEILIFHSHVASLGQLAFKSSIISTKFFKEICQSIPELNHPLSGNGDL